MINIVVIVSFIYWIFGPSGIICGEDRCYVISNIWADVTKKSYIHFWFWWFPKTEFLRSFYPHTCWYCTVYFEWGWRFGKKCVHLFSPLDKFKKKYETIASLLIYNWSFSFWITKNRPNLLLSPIFHYFFFMNRLQIWRSFI